MNLLKPYGVTASLIFLVLVMSIACKKEYSFEGGLAVSDSTLRNDTTSFNDTILSGIRFYSCNECISTTSDTGSIWSFYIGSTKLCGKVTRAVISPDSLGMTFFGPSLCSKDSGLIITAFFMENAFDINQQNRVASKASLQYYDNITPSDVLLSRRQDHFTFIITSLIPATGFTGIFNGWVADKQGKLVKVENGMFRIKF